MAGLSGALRVVHADAHLVVAEKPAGLLSVPGRGADKQDCASARIQAQFPDALIVHRLDQATSGLLLFARGMEMQRRLGAAFAQREVGKRYVAIVHGAVGADAGEIDLPLLVDWPNRPMQKVDAIGGKPSRTLWRVIARNEMTTRLELEPVTGRSHQLRVHLQAIGHPILGDALYAPPPVRDASARLLLHATQLDLAHPASGEELHFHSPAPF